MSKMKRSGSFYPSGPGREREEHFRRWLEAPGDDLGIFVGNPPSAEELTRASNVQASSGRTQPRAALYHRVSTLEQDQTAARAELRNAATSRGLHVVMEVEETGSGARNDRPGLMRVMESALRGRIDVVLVRHLDRFGRSALDLLANIQQLEDAGVRFIAVAQSLDIKPNGDAMSKLILTVLSGVAAFERELIRERTRLGLTKAKAAGKLLGRRVSRDAPEPRAVRSLRASGRSWSEIAGQLGCTSSAARRALERLAGNGTSTRPAK